MISRRLTAVLLTFGLLAGMFAIGVPAASAATPSPYFNGFESDLDGWDAWGPAFTPTRVMSGTNGIDSSSGDWHAEASGNAPATDWGGYADEFPEGGYSTLIDVYLDVDGGWSNDTRFDWSSAITHPNGSHRRDFVFNAGFYDSNDLTGPGAETNRFIITASNNAGRDNSFPNNPLRDPISIDTTGWYTFEHRFYDSGAGVLAVDLSIYDVDGDLIHSWTLSDPSDVIGTTVGGNRYGWFANVELEPFAFDNSQLQLASPQTKEDCKNGGWEQYGFENQGDCIRYVNTGQDSR